MSDLIEKVKEQVSALDVVTYYCGQPNRQGKVLCPFHNDKNPSLGVDPKTNTWRCFACEKHGDCIAFVAELKQVNMYEAAKIIADIFNISYEENVQPTKVNIPEYLKKCIKDIGKTDYFYRRGLNENTIKNFCLGYDVKKGVVTIPYSSKLTYYQSRSVTDKKFFKPKTEDAGPEPVYNGENRIKAKIDEPLFMVESQICAMSIEQCGGRAIAIGGIGGWRKAVDAIIKCKYIGGIIICLDNDDPGMEASVKIAEELSKADIKNIEFNIAGSKKDPNELLMEDSSKLKANIRKAFLALRKKYSTDEDSFTSEELAHETIAPTDWVVKDLLPTGLSFLCAKSKSRKSWMALQLCIAAVSGGMFLDHKCVECEALYYALEDNKSRLQDRQAKMLKHNNGIKGVHFVLHAKSISNGLLDKLEQELRAFPKVKLVIIDTLQKVRGKMSKDNTLYGNEYNEMGIVKSFADKHKICILFIHHLRKMADEDDVFNMMSGSTALMGASDTIFIISKKKRTDESATFSATGRDIEQQDLVINFNNADYKWEVQGTAEEMEARKEREEYEKSPYIRTIKELIKQNPMVGWSGSATDLMKAVYDVTGIQVSDSPNMIGRIINKYETKLYYDGISHKASKGKTRAHTFMRIIRGLPTTYQQCIYDDDNV